MLHEAIDAAVNDIEESLRPKKRNRSASSGASSGSNSPSNSGAPSRPHQRTTSSSSNSSTGTSRPSAASSSTTSSAAHATATLRKPSPLSQGTYTAAEKRMSRDDSAEQPQASGSGSTGEPEHVWARFKHTSHTVVTTTSSASPLLHLLHRHEPDDYLHAKKKLRKAMLECYR